MTIESLPEAVESHYVQPSATLPDGFPPHDVHRWGYNLTREVRARELRRLGDAVRAAIEVQQLPLRAAARWILDELAGLSPPPQWFVLDAADWPRATRDTDAWEPPVLSGHHAQAFVDLNEPMHAAPPATVGADGLARFLDAWSATIAGVDELESGPVAALAVPAEMIAALPWRRAASARQEAPAAAPAADQAAGVVQPEGGQWPHVENAPWSEAERVAAFKMRHKHKRTGAQLADVIGVTRQRIDQEIGPQRIDGKEWDVGLQWRPSQALLIECGVRLKADLYLQLSAGARR